jgi:uncharacterized protein (UPF0548 family)
MFLIRKPEDARIRDHLAAQAVLPFLYRAVGATRATPPAGYVVDHGRVVLGRGAEAFQRARAAVRRWDMFRLGWVELFPSAPPLRVGETVGVLVRRLGLWSLNACRIVYVVDEAGPVERFGFAYGTLPGHAVEGEERFTVEWHRADDSVWYDLLAFSRLRHPLAWVGFPLARRIQRRFAGDSQRAMVEAVR